MTGRLRQLFDGITVRARRVFVRPPRWSRVEELFTAALEIAPEARGAYLDAACGSDRRLRTEVRSLLEASERIGLVDRPLDDVLVPLLGEGADGREQVSAFHRFESYELLERIPGGGMSILYRARDARLNRVVAVKVLPPALDADRHARERFLLEARAAAALDHRNVCTIHEIAVTGDGQPYIVMPFYNGETVAQRIARGPLPVVEVLAIAGQLARGLAHAHAAGTIHRDVKPANVMITHDGVVKILDFGVAKLADRSITRTGAALGTLPYMSPEQIRREAVDGRTDIWSLGVVVFEMLAGRRPFERPDEHTLREAIVFARPASLRVLRPDVPEALALLVERALAKHAEDRVPSAEAFGAVLDEIADSPAHLEPVAAPPRHEPVADVADVLPGGERRQATIMVSSLAGYAELLDRCAPEEAELMIRRFKQDAWSVVERHGGTVNEFGEDRIVLLFGVPATLEDPCARAARTALELRDLMRHWRATLPAARHLALHTAIDTGEVAVHRVEAALVPYRVAGPPVRRASHLCAHARTDRILVSADASRALGGLFVLSDSEVLLLPDEDAPVTPRHLDGMAPVTDRLDQLDTLPTLTPFAGRTVEAAALVRAFADACAGQGRIVTVSGEAGIGKSRLLLEVRRRMEEAGARVVIGRCSPYEGGTPYYPWLQVLVQVLGLDPSGRHGWTDEDIAARATSVDSSLQVFIPFYLRLLSVASDRHPVPNLSRQDQLSVLLKEAQMELLASATRQQPVAVLLEDWHWVDPASQALLEQVATIGAHRLLVVVTTRGVVDFGGRGAAGPHTLVLGPLERASTSVMLRALLDADGIPSELEARLHERAAGNPFFLEEIVRSLVEAGTVRVEGGHARLTQSPDSLQLPASVQAVIRTRLDRLDLVSRRVVRAASVIGRDFARDLLDRAMGEPAGIDAALETLVASGIIERRGTEAPEAFRFRHALAQEVAYAGLLEHQRGDLHRAVGCAIEALRARHMEQWLNTLARHFSLAEDWPRAVDYGLRSVERMRVLCQYAEALEMLEEVRRWAAMLDEEARTNRLIELLFVEERLCDVLGLRDREARTIEELFALLESSGDQRQLAAACLRQGDLLTLVGHFEAAEAALQRSLALRREMHDPLGERTSLRGLAFLRWSQRRYEEARVFNEEALRINRREGQLAAAVGDLHNLAAIHIAVGDLATARRLLEEALETSASVREDAANVELRAQRVYALHNYGCLLTKIGDLDRAIAILGPDGEWMRTGPDAINHAHFYTAAGHAYLKKGMLEECLAAFRKAIESTRRARFAPMLAQALARYGDILLALERSAEAVTYLEDAARLFADLADSAAEGNAWAKVASARERMGETIAAQGAWEKAGPLRRLSGDRHGELEALEQIARLSRQHRPPAVALRVHDEAIAVAEELNQAPQAARLCNSAGILEWTRGQYGAALERFTRGLELFRLAGDPAGEGLMLNSIGVTLAARGEATEARAQLERAVEHHEQTCQPLLAAHALAALGDLLLSSGDLDGAHTHFESSLEKRRRLNDMRGEGWMLQRLARIHGARGERNATDEAIARARECARRCGDDELLDACDNP